ncbi:ferritin-like domain-containing protein [Gordonia sp. SID5947]|uniref:ferritin-like domain-containing protein n=1 Tax=Gordonia sp. SID5947 TaxID=2690315 RepID=UPI00136FE154|nr:ferritin-like domain-containing protein [Gordonia sp. SID5947]MYR07382.1 ferritin-like domain-containing protein [Gordonia sp. SID5947]
MSSQVESGNWSDGFRTRAVQRTEGSDPPWSDGSRLDPAIVRSLQKFQVGESGDGAHLIANAAATGDRDYEAAARLFVAEEQNHARMLRILADEHHHVPFQIRRLRLGFRDTPAAARIAIKQIWRAMAAAVIVVVALDHGRAMRVCGVSRREFVTATMRIFDDSATSVFSRADTSDRH